MTYQEFISRILEDEKYIDQEARHYIRKHARRSYNTYNFCLKHLRNIIAPKILSVGGFHGTIEKMLKEKTNAEITVIDFPDTVEMFKPYYDFLGFKYVGIDLSKGINSIPESYFDLIIYTEVIEHIPLSPYKQLIPFDKFLKVGGKILVTTPNHSSIVHIMKLFMQIPIYAPAEEYFSEVAQENLQIHRREYMPGELIECFDKMKYKSHLDYFIYNEPKNLQYRIMFFIGQIIPRFREGMMIMGEKIS